MSILDSQTGPSAGSASQICYRIQARQASNCIALGGMPLSMEAFSNGVAVPGSSLELRIKHLIRKGGEDLFEGADGEIGDTLFWGGVSLGGTNEVFHIDVCVL